MTKNNDPMWNALKEIGKQHGAVIIENGKTKDYAKINKSKKLIARIVGIIAVTIWIASVIALIGVILWVTL